MNAATYERRRDLHRPRTAVELRTAAQQMIRDGLGEHSIAAVLRLDVTAVKRLLGSCGECNS